MALYADKLMVLDHGHVSRYGDAHDIFAHAEELTQMGLSIPQVTRVFLELRKLGLDVEPVYTIQQAVDALTALKGGARPC